MMNPCLSTLSILSVVCQFLTPSPDYILTDLKKPPISPDFISNLEFKSPFLSIFTIISDFSPKSFDFAVYLQKKCT